MVGRLLSFRVSAYFEGQASFKEGITLDMSNSLTANRILQPYPKHCQLRKVKNHEATTDVMSKSQQVCDQYFNGAGDWVRAS